MHNRLQRSVLAVLLAIACIASIAVPATAVSSTSDVIIDRNATGSITIYKIDETMARTDPDVADALDDAQANGLYDDDLYDMLIANGIVNTLGNGEESHGYGIKGVVFQASCVAQIATHQTKDALGEIRTELVYGVYDGAAPFLEAIGLEDIDAMPNMTASNTTTYNGDCYYFTPTTLIDALNTALSSNRIAVKNALEEFNNTWYDYILEETNEDGYTYQEVELGLWLITEYSVPEMVTSTTDPFLVSVPTSTQGASNNAYWNYDPVIWPKNETGIPSLEITSREAAKDTGKNGGRDNRYDGYSHNTTASGGDLIDFQVISRLPAITSEAAYLTDYELQIDTSYIVPCGSESHEDFLAEDYNENDVVIRFYQDEACTSLIDTWRMDDTIPKFEVSSMSYSSSSRTSTEGGAVHFEITEAGLNLINKATSVYRSPTQTGYSSCYMRVTFGGKMITMTRLGDNAMSAEARLTWARTTDGYEDSLVDDTHIYSYGIELTKEFADSNGDPTEVQFKLYNQTDGYWVNASESGSGNYTVTDHTNASLLNPAAMAHNTSSTSYVTVNGNNMVGTASGFHAKAGSSGIPGVDLSGHDKLVVSADITLDPASATKTDTNGLYIYAMYNDGSSQRRLAFYKNNITETQHLEVEVYNPSHLCNLRITYGTAGTNIWHVDNLTVTAPNEFTGAGGTTFVPDEAGNLTIRGIEDDTYLLTEVKTDNGYSLLKEPVTITITTTETNTNCNIYESDEDGVVQNDPRYEDFDGYQELSHHTLTASATIDSDDVDMDNTTFERNQRVVLNSGNAFASLTIINHHDFELPRSGERGVWMFAAIGLPVIALASGIVIFLLVKRKKNDDEEQEPNNDQSEE